MLLQIRYLRSQDWCELEQSKPVIEFLDILNIFMALLILIIVGKVMYDYWNFSRHGKVPWLVGKIWWQQHQKRESSTFNTIPKSFLTIGKMIVKAENMGTMNECIVTSTYFQFRLTANGKWNSSTIFYFEYAILNFYRLIYFYLLKLNRKYVKVNSI